MPSPPPSSSCHLDWQLAQLSLGQAPTRARHPLGPELVTLPCLAMPLPDFACCCADLLLVVGREMILRRPHEFKIATLQDIRNLFPPDWNPFYAGFGNRDTDEISYREVGRPGPREREVQSCTCTPTCTCASAHMVSHGQPHMDSHGQPHMVSHGQPHMLSHGQPHMRSHGQPHNVPPAPPPNFGLLPPHTHTARPWPLHPQHTLLPPY